MSEENKIFSIACEEFSQANNKARDIRIKSWSLYLFDYPSNDESNYDEAFFIFKGSYTSKEEAVEASKTKEYYGGIQPIWFVVEEKLAANGERFDIKGNPIFPDKQRQIEYLYRVESGIFSGFLWEDDKWMPYICALGGYSKKLFIRFNSLPENWDIEEAKEYMIDWTLD